MEDDDLPPQKRMIVRVSAAHNHPPSYGELLAVPHDFGQALLAFNVGVSQGLAERRETG